jgi:hypothetical protein
MRPDRGLEGGPAALLCVGGGFVFLLFIFYLLTMQKALTRVSRGNRLMEPEKVFLNLVPIFNVFWAFKTIFDVCDSLQAEYADRGEDDTSDYGRTVGIIGQGTGLLGWGLFWVDDPTIVLLSFGVSLCSLVLWIIYWTKIIGYSNRLAWSSEDQAYEEPSGKNEDIAREGVDDRIP